MIEIEEFDSGNFALIWDAQDVLQLWNSKAGIKGTLIGSVAGQPSQNILHGLPLYLNSRELLLYKSYIATLSTNSGASHASIDKHQTLETVVSDATELKPCETTGLHYGAHACLYEGDPIRFHSRHLLFFPDSEFEAGDLITFGRTANSVKKGAILRSKRCSQIVDDAEKIVEENAESEDDDIDVEIQWTGW